MADDLRTIVQRMIDAGEPESAIASVIQRHQETSPEGEVGQEPDTFASGVMNSIMGGEALTAGLKGGLGFLKGATVDIPSSIGGMLSSVGNAISDPIGTLRRAPQDIANMGRGIRDVTMRAGSDPMAFGEMMGQVTGQPLVTAGLLKGAPEGVFGSKPIPSAVSKIRNPVAAGLETTGRIMREKQPLSGMIPRVAEPRVLRVMERALGENVENLGRRMRTKPEIPVDTSTPRRFSRVPYKEGEVVPEDDSIFSESQNELPPATSRQTPPNEVPPRRRLGSATSAEKPTSTGVKAKPKTSSGPFEAQGDVDLKSLPKVVIDKLHNVIDETFGSEAPASGSRRLLDSRISGLPPEEVSPPNARISSIASRMAQRTGPTLMEQLSNEAMRYGMSIEDYVDSLRRGGGDQFVMPSAQLPRVR